MNPLDAKPLALKGIVGIENMGNMCYVNAIIQLLRTCQDWNIFCLTNSVESFNNKKTVLAYKDIVATIWSAYRPAYVRPLAFISEIRNVVQNTPYAMFGTHMQQDAHEYLSFLLDQFHEELKVPVELISEELVSQELVSKEPNQDKMMILAEKAWNYFLLKHTSVVVDTFFGMLRKTVVCSNCNNRTYQWELFNSLKIPCEGETLHEWICKEVNEVTDIDAYKCDSCNGRHSAKKYSHIWKMPKHLFILINRFQNNNMKNMTTCNLVDTLSFKQFYAEEVQTDNIYELCGIVDHHGPHIHSGHYTAQYKHPISKEWWLFDDNVSHEISHAHFGAANYILSYHTL